jgi:predicted DNA-binding protein with PD1-like motif
MPAAREARALTALRLGPGEDLRAALETLTRAQGWTAAWVVSGVGSLQPAALRFAGAKAATSIDRPLEVLSLSGSLSPDGAHLHMSVADAQGAVLGGHVAVGCRIRTTAELLVAVLPDLAFRRAPDAQTGHDELQVSLRD